MDLVLSSHARMRKKDFWRQLFSEAKTDERAVEHLAKLYGSAKYYKPLLSNDKDSDESGNVLQIGSGVENLHTCLIKDHLGGSKLTLAASPAFFKKLGETGHPLPTDGSVKQRVVERDENYWAKLTPAEGGEKYRLIVDNGAMEELLVGISDKKQLSETAAAYLNATLSALKPSGQFFIITMAVESTISEFMRHFCYRTEYSYSCYPMNLDRANDCYGPVLLVVNLSSSDARKDGENGTDASSKVGSSLSQESGEEAASPGAIAAGAPGPVSGAPQRAMVYYDMRATKVNNALGSTESILQIPKIVRHARMTSFWTSNIADYNEGQLWHFEIQSGAGDNRETCYYLSVYDRVLPTGPEREKILKGLKGTITILAPLADQHHWLYKTERGHQRLAERAACRRVICLFQPDFGILTGDAMNPVKALNKIKEDVGRRLIDLSVDKTQAVLLMTQQESYNDERKEVYRTESQHAGRIFVFDTVVDTDDDEFNDTPPDSSGAEDDATKASGPSEFTRRVVMFECNPRQAQTEVWYKTDNGKTNFQYYHVCHAYQLIILGAMLATPRTTEVSKPINAMLIGLGGGMIAMLCRDLFGKRLNLDAVDIDPTIVDIAEKCFGFQSDERIRAHVADGADFMMKASKAGKTCDYVICDISSGQKECEVSQDVSFPPKNFMNIHTMQAAKALVGDTGLFLLNSVSHTTEHRQSVVGLLKQAFAKVISVRYEEDLNDVFLCYNGDLDKCFENIEKLRSKYVAAVEGVPAIAELFTNTPMYLSERSNFEMTVARY